jgi:hypothetical protein
MFDKVIKIIIKINMKKLIIILVLGLFTPQTQAQINSGNYQIKLVFSQKVIELYSNSMVINPICENPLAAACKKQVWEIKSVPNRNGVYTISNTENNMLLTHTTENAGNAFSMYVKLLPIKPQSQREEQYFNIIEKRNPDRTVAGYIFQPYSRSNPTMAKEYYFGARASSMRWDNCPLELFFNDGADTEKISYEPLLFSLEKVSGGVIVGPSRVMSNVVQAPPVIVSPKSDNKIEVDITTGSDNLEPKSTQHGAEIRIILNNRPDIVKTNINEGKEWPNGSTRRIELPLPADITENDIKEVHLYRKRDGLQYVWQLGEKDNWNVNRVKVNAILFKNGVKTNIAMLDTGAERPRIPGNNNQTRPLYRFIYEGGDSVNEGQFLKLLLAPMSQGRMPSGTSNATLKVTFGTGGDNLEGGNNNVDVTIRLRNINQPITIRNINQTKKLNNFSEDTFTKEIANSQNLDLSNIKEVEIRHTGGGGMFADNWHVDKIYIVINLNGINKVLVDKVGAPIHMFTGDSRSKKFIIE